MLNHWNSEVSKNSLLKLNKWLEFRDFLWTGLDFWIPLYFRAMKLWLKMREESSWRTPMLPWEFSIELPREVSSNWGRPTRRSKWWSLLQMHRFSFFVRQVLLGLIASGSTHNTMSHVVFFTILSPKDVHGVVQMAGNQKLWTWIHFLRVRKKVP